MLPNTYAWLTLDALKMKQYQETDSVWHEILCIFQKRLVDFKLGKFTG